MNSTELKIREAFEKHFPELRNSTTNSEKFFFECGYRVLLNELLSVGYRNPPWDLTVLYMLPEGIEK